jgi:hypothetical protein
MVTKEGRRAAISWDFDDTLLRRERVTRVGGAIIGRFTTPKPLPLDISEVPEQDRGSVNTPFRSLGERIAYRFHSRRKPFPGVVEKLAEVQARGVDSFINTGRENKKKWVDMTEATLETHGMGNLFEGKFFTPEGGRRNLSKAAGIRELTTRYDNVTHVDDDPRTTLYLARRFPDVQFFLIQYGSTGLVYDRKEAATLPNIKRISSFKDVPIAA